MEKYYWIAESNDGFDDKSTKIFDTQKEAYEDMRSAALEKMKWNTEYDEDFTDCDTIEYEVHFYKDEIVHGSYSGIYTYRIVTLHIASEKLKDKLYGIMNLIDGVTTDARNEHIEEEAIEYLRNAKYEIEMFLSNNEK